MNECPLCGLDLKGIREAIEKEREIWRPYDCDLPEYYTWTGGCVDPHWWLQGKVEITYD